MDSWRSEEDGPECKVAGLNPVGWKANLVSNKHGYVTEELPQPCTAGKAGFFFAAGSKM